MDEIIVMNPGVKPDKVRQGAIMLLPYPYALTPKKYETLTLTRKPQVSESAGRHHPACLIPKKQNPPLKPNIPPTHTGGRGRHHPAALQQAVRA